MDGRPVKCRLCLIIVVAALFLLLVLELSSSIFLVRLLFGLSSRNDNTRIARAQFPRISGEVPTNRAVYDSLFERLKRINYNISEADAVTTEYQRVQVASWKGELEQWNRTLIKTNLKLNRVAVENAEMTKCLKNLRRLLSNDERTDNNIEDKYTGRARLKLLQENANSWIGMFSDTAEVQCVNDQFGDTARAFVRTGMRPLFRSMETVYVILHTNKNDFADRHARVMASWGRHVKHMSAFTGLASGPKTENIGIPMEYDSIELVPDTMDTYMTLYKKTMKSFRHGCESIEKYRFFIKIDDDGMLIPYNLNEFFQQINPEQDHYLGVYMDIKGKIPYASGGAGYALSRSLMRKMCAAPPNSSQQTYWDYYSTHEPLPSEWWIKNSLDQYGRPEDVYMGAVLANVTGVKVTGVTAFNYDNPTMVDSFVEFEGILPNWKEGGSMHYVDPTSVYRSYSVLF